MCVHTYFHYQTAVNNRIISGNLDSPEGGIDGMLQAVVCEDVSCRYTHTHTYVCMYVHTHSHTHTYVCTYTHALTHKCLCKHPCTCLYTHSL